MVEMVRKHTVPGTGNHRTISGCVYRCKDMLRDAKDIARNFVRYLKPRNFRNTNRSQVEPKQQREQVPLGSSSDSMYPGYSPADHEYGKAAEEYGKAAAEAMAKGIDVKHPDIEYQIGQAKGSKKRTLAAMQAARDSGSGSGTGSGSDVLGSASKKNEAATNGDTTGAKAGKASPETGNPYFVIDTKPTPVELPDPAIQSKERSASPPPEPVDGKEHKRLKKRHDGDLPKTEPTDGVRFEDISEEVDARMKEKEEKRKRKEEKKRKRESGGEPVPSSVAAPETANGATACGASVGDDKPKKKKKKSKHLVSDETTDKASKKRLGEDEGQSENAEANQKKKRKKNKESTE